MEIMYDIIQNPIFYNLPPRMNRTYLCYVEDVLNEYQTIFKNLIGLLDENRNPIDLYKIITYMCNLSRQ